MARKRTRTRTRSSGSRKRTKRTKRRSPTVSFTTRRGKRVSFRVRPYGSRSRKRRRTSWNNAFAKASRACRRKRGVRPFTKKFGQCMKKALKGKRKRSR